jgi:hypothetical protein
MTTVAAFGVGWIVYMIQAAGCCFDGAPSMILQPIMGAAITAISVGVAVLGGCVLRLPWIRRLWSWHWATALAVGGVAVMLLGNGIGLSVSFTDPDTHETLNGLSPAAARISFGLLVFAVANWPAPRAAAAGQS